MLDGLAYSRNWFDGQTTGGWSLRWRPQHQVHVVNLRHDEPAFAQRAQHLPDAIYHAIHQPAVQRVEAIKDDDLCRHVAGSELRAPLPHFAKYEAANTMAIRQEISCSGWLLVDQRASVVEAIEDSINALDSVTCCGEFGLDPLDVPQK